MIRSIKNTLFNISHDEVVNGFTNPNTTIRAIVRPSFHSHVFPAIMNATPNIANIPAFKKTPSQSIFSSLWKKPSSSTGFTDGR